MKSYTVQEFEAAFPDDDACLEFIFQKRYGSLTTCTKCGSVETKFYRVKKRKCYACKHCGYQIYPLTGTILYKTRIPLKSWFRAMYAEGVAKNSVGAKEVQRTYGVCYETALRMRHQIMAAMVQDTEPLTGEVEVDELYFGGKANKKRNRPGKKIAIAGAVERDGWVRLDVPGHHPDATSSMQFLHKNLAPGATLYTDDSRIYFNAKKYFTHLLVNHSNKEYVRGKVHTNTIEGLWSHFNKTMYGTHHHVEGRYVYLYANAFAFKYNHRHVAAGPVLFERIAQVI